MFSVPFVSGCTRIADRSDSGEGLVSFGLWFEGEIKSRAADAPRINSIEVSNDKGVVRSYDSLEAVPDQMWLVSGNYNVAIDAGEKSTATFDGAHYSGDRDFAVSSGSSTEVNVVCKIDNSLFTVNFGDGVKSNLHDYNVKLSVDASHYLVFDASNTERTGYVTLPVGQTSVSWVFTAHTSNGALVTKSGKLADVKSATRYKLSFDYTTKPSGGVSIAIVVDNTTDNYDDIFDLYEHPDIKADNFDMSQLLQERAEAYVLRVTSPSDIASLSAVSPDFSTGTLNLLSDDAAGYGIAVSKVSNTEYVVSVGSAFTAALHNGVTRLQLTVVDAKSNTHSVILRFMRAGINDIATSDVWATHVPVSAEMPQMTQPVRFGYRIAGSTEWQYATGTFSNNQYKATLSALAPSTSYEIQLFVGDNATGDVAHVTTEAAAQLSNMGFEQWYQDKAWYPFASGGEQIWASGNPGAVSIGASWNITTPSTDVRPGSSGSKSANLQSKFPNVLGAGKFAAGNLFVGRYVGTSGTNGVVEFGKPFTCRPTALRGWFKCNVGKVDKAPGGSPVAEGANDRYQILVCLMTEPHQVDTSDKSTFFKPATDASVLAYGEILGTESVSEWKQFTLPITYRDAVTRPAYIAIVVTASSYGDYFAGSTSSWMVVDDFELVY